MDLTRCHWIWWDLMFKIPWIPQDAIGFDEIWCLKSHGSHKMPLDLMRFDCKNRMGPIRPQWIWWDLIAKISWIPQDSIGFDEIWFQKSHGSHDSIPCPGQGLNMTLLAILKVNGANWLLVLEKKMELGKKFPLLPCWVHYWPCPLDKVWTWLFWQY